jgi:hypothetical protein
MRRFTLFTLLYLAVGACLTAIALQHPNLTPHIKPILFTTAGLSYLFAGLNTFGFWHQGVLRSQNRSRDQPAWQQHFVAIAPWLLAQFPGFWLSSAYLYSPVIILIASLAGLISPLFDSFPGATVQQIYTTVIISRKKQSALSTPVAHPPVPYAAGTG